ncbi:nonribosomal peptide synthetase MxaA [Methylobacterium radiodurans]|uniref:Nonribosomal peptide synthetase MxaA n=1 Tax=Methylobacterium radiodurans TaxID=2202828 RepID=A0A2U8VZA8_9HYPH|nr:nonribosomal peptide synthetase MxaA [Methylobacterium radiodurans]AWN38691.1 nonribosomal peptide synthetase MxaA [Methylobacterium radiodurans]
MHRLSRALLVLIATTVPAAAQLRGVEVRAPRTFGYFLGDLVEVTVDVEAEPGFTLQAASLPSPGPVTYWLDLRRVEALPPGGRDGTHHRLRLTYQTFYAAIDARSLEVPGFSLVLASGSAHGATTAAVPVPGWSLGLSPLREVQPARRTDPAEYLRPDGQGPRLDPGPPRVAALALAGLFLAALLLLARDRAWWPFQPRPARAFAEAARRLAALGRAQGRGPEDESEGELRYRAGLLALHRGLDAKAGHRVLADDLDAFLAHNPAYRGQRDALVRFFAASRLAFFGGAVAEARERLPLREARATAEGLAAAERAA